MAFCGNVLLDKSQSSLFSNHIMVPGFLFQTITEADVFRALNLFEVTKHKPLSMQKKILIKTLISKLAEGTEKESQSFTFLLKKEEKKLILDIYYLSHINSAETIVQRLYKPNINDTREAQTIVHKLSEDLHIDMVQQQGNASYYWVTISVLLTHY